MPDPIIHTRLSQNYPLTDAQVDANFVNLKQGILDGTAQIAALTAADIANVPSGTISATNVQGAINQLAAVYLVDYDALRAYTGDFDSVYITGFIVSSSPSGIAGPFTVDLSDITSDDDNGTIIVGNDGRRWKRTPATPIRVSNFAPLVTTVSAKSPGDPASHIATSFVSHRAAVQGALDAAYNRGGGTVIIDGVGPLLLDDYVVVRDNTRVEFQTELKLADYTTVGGIFLQDGDNIEIINPMINGSGLYAGGSGQNGIGILSGNNIRYSGGYVVNCARGNSGPKDGGKAFQFESTYSDIRVDGVALSNNFMAMSANHDFVATDPCGPLIFSNITAENCQILLFVKQTNGTDTTGQKHSVLLSNFVAKNCGTHEGVFQFSRAANVKVENGLIVNSSPIDSIFRGNVRYSTFENIQFVGDCAALINLDPSEYAPDSSHPLTNNTYDIHHTGTAGYIANASITTTNRVLVDSEIKAHLSNDVTTKIAGDELRNAYCKMEIQQGGKTAIVSTATLYLESKAKFSNFANGINVPRLNSGQVSFPSTQVPSTDRKTLTDFDNPGAASSSASWTPIDLSGAGLTFVTAYGDYVKIGPLIIASFRITYPVTATTFSTVIGGLPAASANRSGRVVNGLALRYTDYGGLITAANNPGASTFSFASGAGVILQNVNVSGKTIDGVMIYLAQQ